MDGGDASLKPIHLASQRPFRLGAVRVEPARCLLIHDNGRQETLQPRVMQVFVALARAAGHPLSRNDLSSLCWDGRLVSADALNRVISKLHALVGGIGADSFRVETLNKVGYRLLADINTSVAEPARDTIPVAGSPDRRLVLAAAGALGVAAAGYGVFRLIGPRPSRPLIVAVLPLDAVGSDPALALAARNLAAAVRADLARIDGTAVVAGPSADAAPRQALSAQDIGGRLGADLLVGGAVAKAASGLQVQLTLSDVRSNHQIWSTAVTDGADGGNSAIDAARAAVIQQMEGLVRPVAASAPRREGRGDPEAYRLVVQARQLLIDIRTSKMRGDRDQAFAAADQAEALARQALTIEPANASANVVLAQLTRNGWTRAAAAEPLTTEQRAERSLQFIRRALLADPNDPGALTELGDQYRRFQWRWDAAESLFRRAIAGDPGLIDAHWSYSHQLGVLARAVEGLDHALTVFERDPVNPWHTVTLPRLLYSAGQKDPAMRRYDIELARAPDNLFLLYELYYLHLAEGDAVSLRALSRRMGQLWAGRTPPPGVQVLDARISAAVDALSGRPQALAALIDAEVAAFDSAGAAAAATLQGRARDDLPFIFAIEYGWAGRPARAVDMLDRALAAKSLYWPYCLPYGQAPFPAAVRADPRYADLWRRDPRLADAIDRRRQAVEAGQGAGVLPDGRRVVPTLPATLQARVRAVMATGGSPPPGQISAVRTSG